MPTSKGIKYIKINKKDANGNDYGTSLNNLDQLVVKTGTNISTYKIDSITQPTPDYYLYKLKDVENANTSSFMDNQLTYNQFSASLGSGSGQYSPWNVVNNGGFNNTAYFDFTSFGYKFMTFCAWVVTGSIVSDVFPPRRTWWEEEVSPQTPTKDTFTDGTSTIPGTGFYTPYRTTNAKMKCSITGGGDFYLTEAAGPSPMNLGFFLFPSGTLSPYYWDYVYNILLVEGKHPGFIGQTTIDTSPYIGGVSSANFEFNKTNFNLLENTEYYLGMYAFVTSSSPITDTVTGYNGAGKGFWFNLDEIKWAFHSDDVAMSNSSQLTVIEPYLSQKFQNTSFDVLMNNVNTNVANSYIQVVEYDSGSMVPSNLQPILSQSATKAQVPDSYYTSYHQILPRYSGSKVTSLDYNTYVSGGNYTSSFGAKHSSWEGDLSYGKTSTIDKNPKYFAHFRSAYPSLDKLNTMVFEIDYLIPVEAAEQVTEVKSAGEIPGIIKVTGDGGYQYLVSNNFEKNRKATIDFTQDITSGSAGGSEIYWSRLESGSHPIFQGGTTYETIVTTQTGSTVNTSSRTGGVYFNMPNDNLPIASTPWRLNTSSQAGEENYLMMTANGNMAKRHYANLWYEQYGGIDFKAPDPINLDDMWRWTQTSTAKGYNYQTGSYNSMFRIREGDEIRTFSTSGEFLSFTVITMSIGDGLDPTTSTPPTNYYTTLSCYPPPSNYQLVGNTQDGNAGSDLVLPFTIRRRIQQDNKIMLSITNPDNTNGIVSQSSDGFIVPEDFTYPQKESVGSLIGVMKSNNVFKQE